MKRTLASERDGFVYFLRRGDDAVKIGWSVDPNERTAWIYRVEDDSVELVALFPARRFVEYELHQRFERDRVDGEWFRSTPHLEGAVQLVQILWGMP